MRSRPKQPLDAFIRQSNAVIAHDALDQLGKIDAPTQITFGRHDIVTSTRFAEPLKSGIKGSELVVFENCAHAPIYETVSDFNEKTLNSSTPTSDESERPKRPVRTEFSDIPARRATKTRRSRRSSTSASGRPLRGAIEMQLSWPSATPPAA